MRKTSKWAKVFSIFLLLSLVILNTSSVQGKKGGKGTKTPMNVIIWEGNPSCVYYGDDSPLLSVDTSTGECPEAGSLFHNGHPGFTTFGGPNCMEPITLPGEDLELDTDDDILIIKGSLNTRLDKETGKVSIITFWLTDVEDNTYSTGRIQLDEQFEDPTPTGFRITVCRANLPVTYKKRGDHIQVGYISVGVIDYVPKD